MLPAMSSVRGLCPGAVVNASDDSISTGCAAAKGPASSVQSWIATFVSERLSS
jgi:hypothetical protein